MTASQGPNKLDTLIMYNNQIQFLLLRQFIWLFKKETPYPKY